MNRRSLNNARHGAPPHLSLHSIVAFRESRWAAGEQSGGRSCARAAELRRPLGRMRRPHRRAVSGPTRRQLRLLFSLLVRRSSLFLLLASFVNHRGQLSGLGTSSPLGPGVFARQPPRDLSVCAPESPDHPLVSGGANSAPLEPLIGSSQNMAASQSGGRMD